MCGAVIRCTAIHFRPITALRHAGFDDILEEIRATFAVHRAEGSYLGGVHLEMTGDNVTECVGGANGLNEEGWIQITKPTAIRG